MNNVNAWRWLELNGGYIVERDEGEGPAFYADSEATALRASELLNALEADLKALRTENETLRAYKAQVERALRGEIPLPDPEALTPPETEKEQQG
jgi:hypothetical protein